MDAPGQGLLTRITPSTLLPEVRGGDVASYEVGKCVKKVAHKHISRKSVKYAQMPKNRHY